MLLFSCTDQLENNTKTTSLKFNKGHFDGIAIGDSANYVRDLLQDSLLESSFKEMIFFAIPDDPRIEKRELRTALDNGVIYEITADFYLKSDSLIPDFFSECKASLDDIYGNSNMDEGYANWRSASVHNKVIEIELFDMSINSAFAMVSVNFFEDFDKSFYAE